MDDLISRQEAIEVLLGITPMRNTTPLASAIFNIEKLPSVQPEIIRCRDCMHWDKTWKNDWAPNYQYCPMIDRVRNGNWFCADAERRTE